MTSIEKCIQGLAIVETGRCMFVGGETNELLHDGNNNPCCKSDIDNETGQISAREGPAFEGRLGREQVVNHI